VTDFTGLYCTDENVAIEARGDYAALISASSQLAAGTDGAFGSGNRWLLTSASNDFAAQGVPAGAVCTVKTQTTSQLYAVSGTSGGLLLRRLGLADGQGLPPGVTFGSSAVQFDARTCLADIAEATRWLNQRFRIPALNELEVTTDLRRATVLLVLIDLFGSQTRAGEHGNDNWGRKMKTARDELDSLYTILDRTYGLVPQARRVSEPEPMVQRDCWRNVPNW
jgi:hypothetical protein